jgi:hypothetical protein
MKENYVVILNFESGRVEALSLANKPEDMDAYEFIESPDGLDYSLSNCEWMIVESPVIYPLNF